MTTNTLYTQFLRFVFFIVLQVFLFNGLVLFNVAFCFVYVGIIIALPKEIIHTNLILLSFLCGLIVDAFYNTMGMHAAACTLIGYLRPYILLLITPQRGYEEKADFSIKTMGLIWFLTYAGIIIFIHHLIIFYLEIGSFSLFFTTLVKVVTSAIFTMFVIVIFQYFRKQ
jgi:hypothetical protein